MSEIHSTTDFFEKEQGNPLEAAVFFGAKEDFSRELSHHFRNPIIGNFSSFRAELMKVPDATVGTAVFCEVIEPVLSDEHRLPDYLNEVHRILTPGGRAWVINDHEYTSEMIGRTAKATHRLERHASAVGDAELTAISTIPHKVNGFELAKIGKLQLLEMTATRNEASSEQLVSDAMRYALTPKDHLGRPVYEVPSAYELAENTREACHRNSKMVLSILRKNGGEVFDRLFLFTDTVSRDQRYGKNWVSHSCFCARDTNGVWMVGSPANYMIGETSEQILRLESGKNLTQLLQAHYQTFGRTLPEKPLLQLEDALPFYPVLEPDVTSTTPLPELYAGQQYILADDAIHSQVFSGNGYLVTSAKMVTGFSV